ncbi:MAG: Ku protein [Candidatus Dormibacteria bacterium]
MPRSMWRGAISFGMVAIPVRLYLATESKSVSFRMLCPDCHTPIRNKRWCPNEDKEIPWNATVRGYEVGKDEFVEIDDNDLDELPLTTSHTCEILEFCDDGEIEAGVYIKSAYYLEPEAVGVKPYYLLKAALESTGKVAVGKIAFRDREHLCRLALHEKGLLLNTLHWPDEIRDAGELSLPEAEARPEIHKRELDMAVMLVDNLSASFDPERYKDNYREALTAVVEAKVNDTPLQRAAPERTSKVTDLMAALKASVAAAQKGDRAEEPSGSRQAARRRQAGDGARRRKAS